MKISEAKKLAKKLIESYGLYSWGINFEANKEDRVHVIASCSSVSRDFYFNSAFIFVNSIEFCKDQILHEIAHALLAWGVHHGEAWRKKCIEIGAIPYEAWQEEYPCFNRPLHRQKEK